MEAIYLTSYKTGKPTKKKLYGGGPSTFCGDWCLTATEVFSFGAATGITPLSQGGEKRGFLRHILKAPLLFSSGQKIPRMIQKEGEMSHLETRILLIGFVPFAFTMEGCLGKPGGSLKRGLMLVHLNTMAFLLLLL